MNKVLSAGLSRTLRSTMLIPLILGLCLNPAAGQASDFVPSQKINVLKEQLEPLGWQVERSGEGDILLWPQEKQPDSEPIAIRIADSGEDDQRIAMSDFSTLKKKLENRGWMVRRDPDGALLVFPDKKPDSTSPSVREEVQPTIDQYEDLRAMLSGTGWQSRREESGDLLLFPRSSASVPATNQDPDPVSSKNVSGLHSQLVAAGWKVEEKSDGTLLLFPSSASARGTQSSIDPAASGIVEQPVDTWGKAHTAALHWLSRQGAEGLKVGKIRRINWVYLVSIVTDEAPFRLKNQLVVRIKDGRVIPVE